LSGPYGATIATGKSAESRGREFLVIPGDPSAAIVESYGDP